MSEQMRLDKIRQDTKIQYKTRQGKVRQDNAVQYNIIQYKTI